VDFTSVIQYIKAGDPFIRSVEVMTSKNGFYLFKIKDGLLNRLYRFETRFLKDRVMIDLEDSYYTDFEEYGELDSHGFRLFKLAFLLKNGLILIMRDIPKYRIRSLTSSQPIVGMGGLLNLYSNSEVWNYEAIRKKIHHSIFSFLFSLLFVSVLFSFCIYQLYDMFTDGVSNRIFVSGFWLLMYGSTLLSSSLLIYLLSNWTYLSLKDLYYLRKMTL